MKQTDVKLTRYEAGDYWIDIVELPNEFESWITHKNYGVSDLMFGCPKQQQTLDSFIDLVRCNLADYIALYKEDHEED